jgi:hypothetical protein
MAKNTFSIDLEKLTMEERELLFELLKKGNPDQSQNKEDKTDEKL